MFLELDGINRDNVGSAECLSGLRLLWAYTQLHTMTVVPSAPSGRVHEVCGSLQVGLTESEI